MPLEATCSNEEAIPVTYRPITPLGHSAKLDGPLQVQVIDGDPSAFSIVGDDGLSVTFCSGDVVGDVLFKVRGDGDLGTGVVEIVDTFTLHVTGAQAASLQADIGAAIPKPAKPV